MFMNNYKSWLTPSHLLDQSSLILTHQHVNISHTLEVFQVTWISIWLLFVVCANCWPLNIPMLGVSICVCKRSGCHLVTHMEDHALFNVILSPSHDIIPIPNPCGTLAHATSVDYDKKNMSRRWQGKTDWVHELTMSPNTLYIVWQPWLEKGPLEVYHLHFRYRKKFKM